MTGFQYPGKNHQEDSDYSRGAEERKLPDFVFVNSEYRHHQEYPGGVRREFDPGFQKLAMKEYPFMLRVLCLVLSMIIFVVSAVASLFVIFFFLANVVTFFRLKPFWHQTKLVWKQLKKLFVTGLALLVAVFSPAFGFSIMMVYLLMKGNSMDEDWVARMMKERLYK